MSRCLDCGKASEREGHQECPYPGLHLQVVTSASKRRIRLIRRPASREEQHGRYIDRGPSAWDDR